MATLSHLTYERPARKVVSFTKAKTKRVAVTEDGKERGIYPPSIEGGNKSPSQTPTPAGSVSVESVMESMAGLSVAELKQVLAHVSLLVSQPDPGQLRDKDMWSQSVWDAAVAAFGGSGGGLPGPLVFKRILAAPAAWEPVNEFMADSKLATLTVTERQAVYNLLAKLVLRSAQYVSRERDVPMSPKLLASCAHNLRSLFDQAFPGYLRAGLACVVAKSLTRRA